MCVCGGGGGVGEGMVIKLGVGILKERHFLMHAVLSNFGITKVYIDILYNCFKGKFHLSLSSKFIFPV